MHKLTCEAWITVLKIVQCSTDIIHTCMNRRQVETSFKEESIASLSVASVWLSYTFRFQNFRFKVMLCIIWIYFLVVPLRLTLIIKIMKKINTTMINIKHNSHLLSSLAWACRPKKTVPLHDKQIQIVECGQIILQQWGPWLYAQPTWFTTSTLATSYNNLLCRTWISTYCTAIPTYTYIKYVSM